MAIWGSANVIAASDLITEVLSLYGQYVPGETIATADAASLLFTLNGILDGLGGEKLAIFAPTSVTFTLQANRQAHLLGPAVPGTTADWTIALSPASLYAVSSFLDTATEQQLRILTDGEWNAISNKSTAFDSVVRSVYIAPAGTNQMLSLSFYPIPNRAVPVVLYFRQPLALLSDPTNTILLPPGYQEFLTYELAIKAAPKFGANLPAWIYTARQESKTRVKEANFQAADSRVDRGLLGRGYGWNIYTGE